MLELQASDGFFSCWKALEYYVRLARIYSSPDFRNNKPNMESERTIERAPDKIVKLMSLPKRCQRVSPMVFVKFHRNNFTEMVLWEHLNG